jgi:hypothetical protein
VAFCAASVLQRRNLKMMPCLDGDRSAGGRRRKDGDLAEGGGAMGF